MNISVAVSVVSLNQLARSWSADTINHSRLSRFVSVVLGWNDGMGRDRKGRDGAGLEKTGRDGTGRGHQSRIGMKTVTCVKTLLKPRDRLVGYIFVRLVVYPHFARLLCVNSYF